MDGETPSVHKRLELTTIDAMNWPERIAAGVTALVCLAFLVRLLLPAPAQQRLDSFAKRHWYRLKDAAIGLWRGLRGRPQARQQQKLDQIQAERLAREAIEKARRGVERDGNVIRPKAFKGRDHDPH
jgi:hypothetical protein